LYYVKSFDENHNKFEMTHFLICDIREDIISLIHDNITVSLYLLVFFNSRYLMFFPERSLFYVENQRCKIHNINALGYGYGIGVTGRERCTLARIKENSCALVIYSSK